MAKKKTENIKAAPVLRANSGGEQPTPEQTGTRTYQIMDPWKDRGVTNLVNVKAVDGEITDVKVNGVPAGGGGGGVTTAEVIFVNNTNDELEIYIPYLDHNPVLVDYFNTIYYAGQGSNDPIITPLYNGQAYTGVPDHTIEASGSATVIGEGVKITGNCTITIS